MSAETNGFCKSTYGSTFEHPWRQKVKLWFEQRIMQVTLDYLNSLLNITQAL